MTAVSPSIGPVAQPCISRQRIRIGKFGAKLQPRLAMTNVTSMATNRLRLPITLPSQPRMGVTRVRVIRKLVVTHWAVARSVPKAAMRRGMARLTLFPANVCVTPASKMMPATNHL